MKYLKKYNESIFDIFKKNKKDTKKDTEESIKEDELVNISENDIFDLMINIIDILGNPKIINGKTFYAVNFNKSNIMCGTVVYRVDGVSYKSYVDGFFTVMEELSDLKYRLKTGFEMELIYNISDWGDLKMIVKKIGYKMDSLGIGHVGLSTAFSGYDDEDGEEEEYEDEESDYEESDYDEEW